MAISETMVVNGNTSRTALKGRTVNDDLNGTFTVYSADKIPQIMIGPDPDTGYSSIKLYDLQGVQLVAIAINDSGMPLLSFSNTDGVEMMRIGLTGSSNNPLIEMNDADGVMQITMGTDAAAGQANVSVYDTDGTRITYMGIDPKGGALPVIAASKEDVDVLGALNE